MVVLATGMLLHFVACLVTSFSQLSSRAPQNLLAYV